MLFVGVLSIVSSNEKCSFFISLLTSLVVKWLACSPRVGGRAFDPLPGQTKDNKIVN